LADAFKSAEAQANPTTRWLAVKIVNEQFELLKTGNQTGNIGGDFDSMASVVNDDDPLYFVFRLEGKKNWLVISYVPPNTKVKDKMLNASAKSELQRQLGFQFFTQEFHTNNREELSWAYYHGQTTAKPFSAGELEHQRILADEDAERNFRAKPSGGAYHSVAMPLSAGAQDKVRQFSSGSVNFVELVINAAKNGIDAGAAENVGESDLPRRIHSREPRFYLYKSGVKSVFIFSCPDNAAPQLKMTYSSAKGSVETGVGVQFGKRIEIRDASELSTDLLRSSGPSRAAAVSPVASAMTGRSTPGVVGRAGGSWEGSTAPAAKSTTGQKVDSSTPHPIYSLITGDSPQRNPNRKTVIVPPKSAW
jgi:twinfilin-like protein